MLLASLLLLLPSHVSVLLLSSLHAVAGFITFVRIPLLLLCLPYCVGGPAVALYPAVACVPAVGGHVIVVILAVACCWRKCFC
jgi:hypothetical protein